MGIGLSEYGKGLGSAPFEQLIAGPPMLKAALHYLCCVGYDSVFFGSSGVDVLTIRDDVTILNNHRVLSDTI